MSAVETVTPVQAFDQLREHVARGLPVEKNDIHTIYQGKSERFEYECTVPDQSAAFPGKRVKLSTKIHVIAVDGGRLVLQTRATWPSIFGTHNAFAEYVCTKEGATVRIDAKWFDKMPTPLLDNLDIHTGGVSVDEYHTLTLRRLKDNDMPVSGMLFRGDDEVDIELHVLVDIAKVVTRSTPLL